MLFRGFAIVREDGVFKIYAWACSLVLNAAQSCSVSSNNIVNSLATMVPQMGFGIISLFLI